MASTCKTGKAAELILLARCLLENLNCYVSVAEDNRVDAIVGGKLVRIQVKQMTKQGISVRKIGCNSKSNVKIYRYTTEDVDMFAAVDLMSFDVFLLPMTFIEQYRNCVSRVTIHNTFVANDLSLLTG